MGRVRVNVHSVLLKKNHQKKLAKLLLPQTLKQVPRSFLVATALIAEIGFGHTDLRGDDPGTEIALSRDAGMTRLGQVLPCSLC